MTNLISAMSPLAALLLTPALLTSGVLSEQAAAAEIELSSRIERVTVYPDGAVVTRQGRAQLMAGTSQIVLRGLPSTIDPASIRVEGRSDGALIIGAVDVRIVPGEARPVLDQVIEAKLIGLRDEKARLDGQRDAIETKRATIERFGQAGPEKLGPDGKALPLTDWPSVFDAIGTVLVKVNDELRRVRSAIAEADAQIAALELARPKPGRPGAPRRDIAIAVEAQAPLAADVAITYRVTGASWTPTYEARLSTGNASRRPELLFQRRADLRQRSGEDWSDVALTLSTTRIVGGTRVPDLPPLQVLLREPPMLHEQRQRLAPQALNAPAPAAKAQADASAPDLDEARPADTQTARLEAGAYQASFQVPGKVSIPQDGSSRQVVLSQDQLAPALTARIAAELEERAYLEAVFTHEQEAPLLQGEVQLHRDGAYIGKGRIGLVAPGDRVELGFGADDRLKVKRSPVRRRESEPGWLGQSRTDTREFTTLVKSLHAQPVRIVVNERVPFSETGTISVETLPQTTSPTQTQVADKRGVMEWSFELPAGAEKEVRLAYRIKWPSDRDLGYEPRPPR